MLGGDAVAKLLVVDDDPDLVNLLAFRLRQLGHLVVTAGSADEALSVVADRGLPDLAVLDVLMPGVSGLELLVKLRAGSGGQGRQGASGAAGQLPAVFLSGRVEAGDVAAGRALGATYLTKPVVINALGEAIDDLLLASAGKDGGW